MENLCCYKVTALRLVEKMNVAILFNFTKNKDVDANTLIMGKELYSYSLKAFFLHPDIDCIIVTWNGEQASTMKYVEKWKLKYCIDKPVWQYDGASGLKYILEEFEKYEGRADLYVLHDIGYLFVTKDMIHSVITKAAMHGLAVSAGRMTEKSVLCLGYGMMDMESLRYLKYPAAIKNKSNEKDILMETTEIMSQLASMEPYLCNVDTVNPFVCTREGVEMAEVRMLATMIQGDTGNCIL